MGQYTVIAANEVEGTVITGVVDAKEAIDAMAIFSRKQKASSDVKIIGAIAGTDFKLELPSDSNPGYAYASDLALLEV